MEREKVIAFSGAADEINFLYGKWYDLVYRKGEDFKATHGVSSGAIIAFIHMSGILSLTQDLSKSFNIKKHIFGYNPYSLKGVSIAIKALINGDKGIWEYNNLDSTLRYITSELKFNNYKENANPPIYVGIVNKSGQYINVNLLDLSYNEAIEAVMRSSRIQVLTKQDKGFGDGGLVNHIGNEFLASEYPSHDVISVFARTKEWTKEQPKKGLLNMLGWSISRMMFELSKNNETETDKITQINGTTHIKYFMERDVIEGLFKLKQGQNKELFEMGLNAKPEEC